MPGPNSHDLVAQPIARSPFVRNVLPFLTSLAFHAGLLLLGFAVYQSVKALSHQRAEPPPLEMPDIQQAISRSLDGELAGDPVKLPKLTTQLQFNDPAATGAAMEAGKGSHTLGGSLNAAASNEGPAELFIGAGPGTRGGIGGPGTGTDDGGALAPFGKPQQGGGTGIFNPGRGPAAHSVAFLCDASGSMLSKFAALRVELSKAVTHLKPVQSFSITFFGDNRSNAMNPQLVMATPENQLHATNFLEEVTPRGTTDPLPAIELAFKQKPQLIFLLTDGDFPDNEVVLARIRQLNKNHATTINTIAFVNDTDTDTAFIALLTQIAHENGGVYRHVKLDELP